MHANEGTHDHAKSTAKLAVAMCQCQPRDTILGIMYEGMIGCPADAAKMYDEAWEKQKAAVASTTPWTAPRNVGVRTI